MKKIYSIMLLSGALFFATACESDRDSNPTLHEPTAFVLNTPPYVAGVYDLKNTESVQLTCTQPDYGFTAATTYSVQVSLTKDFAKPSTLPTTYNTAKMDVLANEMAVAVCEMMVGENGYDETDFPEDIVPVYVRLSASLNEGRSQINSNIVELPQVKPYFALSPMEMPAEMYLIGNAFGDWKWDGAVKMVPVHSNPGKFWILQYFGMPDGSKAEVKFNTVKDWNKNEFGGGAAIDDTSKTLAGLSGDDNLVVGTPGWYLVVVTTEISGRDYIYHVEFMEPNVYLTGDPSGGFDVFDEARLFKVPDGLGQFESPAFVAAGELRICIKLEDIDWWKTEFLVLKGKLEYRGTGGDQDRVNVTAGQKVYLNFTDATGEIK